ARVFVEPADGAWSAVSLISIDPRDTVFHFPAVRTRGLRIEVDNADNAPLKIVRFRAMQDCIYLVTWLQTGSSYTLLTGDASAAFPQYDLGYFTDSLTRRPRQIGVGRGQETTIVAGDRSAPAVRSMAKPVGGFVLWSILSTVLLLLIYLSVKMVGAIGAKKEPHDRL
ncbi:MAG TPA: hypothetical protein VHE54_07935, partial [Puia sp.]|nr:hypothetical protein [Puia sp.]